MNWLINTLGSSIGKKLMMAVTGFCFCGFLASHLVGNLTIYGGKDTFNAYAAHLHSLGPLITVAEIGLLFFALVHILTGAILFYQNLQARPVRYSVNKNAGGRTIGSATMPYTGFIILAFVIYHLINFHFVDKTDTTIFQLVSSAFTDPVNIAVYIVAMVAVAVHVSHGFWSLFQTIGATHLKYMPIIQVAGIVFSIVIAIGFGFIPVFISFIA